MLNYARSESQLLLDLIIPSSEPRVFIIELPHRIKSFTLHPELLRKQLIAVRHPCDELLIMIRHSFIPSRVPSSGVKSL
jgi:hypothetical protein